MRAPVHREALLRTEALGASRIDAAPKTPEVVDLIGQLEGDADVGGGVAKVDHSDGAATISPSVSMQHVRIHLGRRARPKRPKHGADRMSLPQRSHWQICHAGSSASEIEQHRREGAGRWVLTAAGDHAQRAPVLEAVECVDELTPCGPTSTWEREPNIRSRKWDHIETGRVPVPVGPHSNHGVLPRKPKIIHLARTQVFAHELVAVAAPLLLCARRGAGTAEAAPGAAAGGADAGAAKADDTVPVVDISAPAI
mmetsp:Transcript_22420/g.63012  ORF Transcript_22420/g.63012 Transcript_22420/m.63012 type:complete len:254 (+) Transcript_22420:266-1027(+)